MPRQRYIDTDVDALSRSTWLGVQSRSPEDDPPPEEHEPRCRPAEHEERDRAA